VLLDFKLPIYPPLVGILDPTSGIRDRDSLFERFNHVGVGYMAEKDKFHVGKPPVFNGNNYDYWKKRMEIHFKALGRNLWRIVMEEYVILDPKIKWTDDDINEQLNDHALSVRTGASEDRWMVSPGCDE
jgi:hypothetical protein